MTKLTREQKIEIYNNRQKGFPISKLTKHYKIGKRNINYLVRLIDIHGIDILRKSRNNYYSPALKEEIINKVLLDKQSINATSLEYEFSSLDELKVAMRAYITYYNSQIISSKLKGLTPVQYRIQSFLSAQLSIFT